MLSYVPLYKAITRRRSAVSIQQSANSFQHSALEKTQERESTPKTSGGGIAADRFHIRSQLIADS
jgi:hypothetical protein